MRYRIYEHEMLVQTFIEKIDDLVDAWTTERDYYKAEYIRAARDNHELRARVATLESQLESARRS